MIGRIDIRANAAHPNFPLPPVYMFAGAPSSPRVFGVPCRVGSWAITAVSVVVAYPDNSTRTVALTQTDGVWIGVIPACATTGAVQSGFQVVADGTDESGNAVTGYCLGVGDLFVMDRDFTATADGTRYCFHYCEETPATPQVGDAVYADGALKWWDGTAWRDFGGSSITVDPALSPTSENPVQNKAVAAALYGKLDGAAAYPAWNEETAYYEEIVSYGGRLWYANGTASIGVAPPEYPWVEKTVSELLGAKQDALSSAQIGYINDVPNKANASDVATALAQKADASDLPYAMVTPGEWEFSGVPSGVTDVSLSWDGTAWSYAYVIGTTRYVGMLPMGPSYDGNELSLTFTISSSTVTATRASLPGHLCDRAGNRVVVSGDTTLTLPAAIPGYIRDFLVRLEISGSTVPTITFAAPTGETIVYETDGDEFPVPDEAGTWSYSFTEDCVAHKFAVSLKQLQSVSQPTQTQGGS